MIFKKLMARVFIWAGLATTLEPTLPLSHKTVRLGVPKVNGNGRINFKHTGYKEHIVSMRPGDKVTFVASDKQTFKSFAGAISAAGATAHGAGSTMMRTDEALQVISVIRLK